jgi:hypothetical protein
MQLIVDKTGEKRTIYSFGVDLNPDETKDLINGDFDLKGKTKADYWYIPATNSLREKTTAEKAADKKAKDDKVKKNDISNSIADMIIQAKDFKDLQDKINAIIGG